MKRRTLVQCLTITIEELGFLEIWIKTQISSDNRSAADLAKEWVEDRQSLKYENQDAVRTQDS